MVGACLFLPRCSTCRSNALSSETGCCCGPWSKENLTAKNVFIGNNTWPDRTPSYFAEAQNANPRLSQNKTDKTHAHKSHPELQMGVDKILFYNWVVYMGPALGPPAPPHPPPMVWSQNLRFAAFRMKTLNLQCFLHGGWLARSANLQIRRISATSLPQTCSLQCFGFDIVE